jgi:hypothetical protein
LEYLKTETLPDWKEEYYAKEFGCTIYTRDMGRGSIAYKFTFEAETTLSTSIKFLAMPDAPKVSPILKKGNVIIFRYHFMILTNLMDIVSDHFGYTIERMASC